MLKNYFKIAIRNLSKNKGYTFINVAGLAVGMGICLFLVLLDHYAYTFDRHHQNSDRIYRVADKIAQDNGSILDVAISPSPWGKALEADYAEIEESTRFYYRGGVAQYENQILRQGVTYVDESIFRIFTYPLKYGNSEGALDGPNKIVLSEDMSVRYFGNENPVGKTILIDGEPFEITGVLHKLHPQSSFTFNSLASFESLTEADYPAINNWRSHNLYTYVLLKEGTDVEHLESRFPEFIAKNIGEEFTQRYTPHLQNIKELYLSSNLYAEQGQTLDISYVYIFSVIALLILFIACINFVNLATAQGFKRAKEVGVRKVLGSSKRQLVFQFLTEAFVLASIAIFISITFVELALPWFNDLANWSVAPNYLSNPVYLVSIFGVVVLVSIIAGGYPAFFLSAVRPVIALKGNQPVSKSKTSLKTILVVAQFTVAVFMLISASAVDGQLDFLKNKDLGFDARNILVTEIPDEENASLATIRGELFRIPGVQEVSFSSNTPGDEPGSKVQYYPEGSFENNGLLVNTYSIDQHFFNQYGIELLHGRDFSRENLTDASSSIIINETAAKRFGWDDPIGKKIATSSDIDRTFLTVVGVVDDFHYETLHNRINPLIMKYDPSGFYDLSIRLNTAELQNLTTLISTKLKDLNGGMPLFHYFLEEDITNEYTTETVIGEMLRYFTYLTLFIACLGLFGLVSYTVVNRKKEIGIRKVLGASIANIIQNISGQFLKLITIGFLIGAPLAYYLIHHWLNSFAYSNPPGLITILWAGVLTIIISMLTISHQAIKAARENPVNSLQSE